VRALVRIPCAVDVDQFLEVKSNAFQLHQTLELKLSQRTERGGVNT
jgi:hypothetical protein